MESPGFLAHVSESGDWLNVINELRVLMEIRAFCSQVSEPSGWLNVINELRVSMETRVFFSGFCFLSAHLHRHSKRIPQPLPPPCTRGNGRHTRRAKT